jgi:RHS repeat-associated protein
MAGVVHREKWAGVNGDGREMLNAQRHDPNLTEVSAPVWRFVLTSACRHESLYDMALVHIFTHRRPRRLSDLVLSAPALIALCFLGSQTATATLTPDQATPTTNVDVSSAINTGCGYDAWTGSTGRVVHDIFPVAGSIGNGGLRYDRIYFSHGGWNHSYSWSMTGRPSTPEALYVVHTPDGRVIDFHSAASSGIPGETAWRSALGTKERLFQYSGPTYATGTADLYLEDGTIVHFDRWTDYVEPGGYLADYFIPQWITDPQGLRTTLTYELKPGQFEWIPARIRLKTVTDATPPPNARTLQFGYDPVNGELTTVTSSDGQIVTYTYTTNSVYPYTHLTGVGYSDGTAGVYTYTTATTINPDTNAHGLVTVLDTAQDTRAAGPMQSIKYTYKPNANEKYYGQVAQEQHYPDGVPVTIFTSDDGRTMGTDTRGDGPSRTFYMTKPAKTPLMRWKTDFNGIRQYFYYDARNYLNQVTDRRNANTFYANEPILGRPTTITHPGGSFADGTAFGSSTNAYSYSFGGVISTANPYFVASITNDRDYVTYYDRDTLNRITQIRSPDTATETYGYNSLNRIVRHKRKNSAYEFADYDTAGRLTKLWNPVASSTHPTSGPQTTYAYYPVGHVWQDRVQTVTDPRGYRTTYEYDMRFDANGVQTSTPCSGRGRVTRMSHPDDTHGGTLSGGTYRSFGYDKFGNTLWEETEMRERTVYTYDDYNRLTSVKLPPTPEVPVAVTTYDYMATNGASPYSHTSNAVRFETSPSGIVTGRTYDPNFRKGTETKGYGVGGLAATTYFAHDANGNLITMTDPRGSALGDVSYTTTTVYDSRNRKTRTTSPPVSAIREVTDWKCDAAGNITSIKRADGTTESKTYDEMNRVLTDIVPKDASPPTYITTTFTYNLAGMLATVKDGNNQVTSFEYDPRDLKTKMTYPQVTDYKEWTYDEVGNAVRRRTVNGSSQLFTYDDRNRMTRMRWSNSIDSSDFAFDNTGRLTLAQNPYSTVNRQYDAAGRLMVDQQTFPATSGMPVPAVQPTSVVSRKSHGAAGNFDIDLPLMGEPGIESRSGGVYQIVATFGTPITFGSATVSSGIGSVASASSAGAVVTINLTGVSSAQRMTVKLSGLSDGTNSGDLTIPMRILVGDTNGNGFVNSTDISQTQSLAGQAITITSFRSDVNANGAINSSDVSAVKANSGQGLPAAPPSGPVSYGYDADGKVTHLYVAGNQYDLNLTYDGLGRLEKIYHNPATNPYYQYVYDASSNVTQRINWLNGTSLSFVLDELNRVKEQTIQAKILNASTKQYDSYSFSHLYYGYDTMDRLTTVTREENAGLADQFGYNGAGELTSASYNVSLTPTPTPTPTATATPTPTPGQVATPMFSPPGFNMWPQSSVMIRISTTTSGAQIMWTADGTMPTPTHGFLINGSTGLVSIGPATLKAMAFKPGMANSAVYEDYYERDGGESPSTTLSPRNVTYNLDAAGNRSGPNGVSDDSNGPTAYTPNNLNQYLQAGNGSEHEINNYQGVQYFYLSDTRLAAVTLGANTYQIGYDALGRTVKRTVNGQSTYLVYDGAKAILEYTSNGTPLANALYGLGVDEIIARNNNGQGQFLMQDKQGSTIAVTGSDGTVLERYSYDAFGAPAIMDPSGSVLAASAINNRYLFTGREWVQGYGFYEYRARAYHPGLGRFMSEDPSGFEGGDYNLFRYCKNDPEDITDPTGLEGYRGAFGLFPSVEALFYKETITKWSTISPPPIGSLIPIRVDWKAKRHTVTIQAFIQTRTSGFVFQGDNRGFTNSPSAAYRSTSTLTFDEITSYSRLTGTTGATHFVGGIYGGTAQLTQSGVAIAVGARTVYVAMTGSASNPVFGGLAPPISYALNAKLNFGTDNIDGSFYRTQYPSFQAFVDGKSVYMGPEAKSASQLSDHTTDSFSSSF